MAEFSTMFNKLLLLAGKVNGYRSLLYWYFRIRISGLFDRDWYLMKYPDVARAKVNPIFHYLLRGGFEGRDPSPAFSSKRYLDAYSDVRKTRLNPLVHYLKQGIKEGRSASPQNIESPDLPYQCPVCKNKVSDFLPIPAYYEENLKKHGYPYTFSDGETLNADQYSCPLCGATDRDRLYALYMDKRLAWQRFEDKIRLFDIAPSVSLSNFINQFGEIKHDTADLLVEDVDFVVDVTNMPEIASDTYDILICSHVLEHVNDDNKALAELYRILKPGGWGIIMVPIVLTIDQIDEDPAVVDIAERWRRFGQDDHVRLYNKSGFIERIENAGFTVKQLGMDYFGTSAFKQYGIDGKSILYVAEKQ